MSTFVLEEWHRGNECTIYSIRKDVDNPDAYTEADSFFEKYVSLGNAELEEATKLLLQFVVNEIAAVHGAKEVFFNRFEKEAQALPYISGRRINDVLQIDNFYPGFPLRLYCYRISENIVVLYNGGMKTSQSAQDSSDLSMKFYEAQIYTRKIIDALRDGILYINDSKLGIEGSDDELIL